MNILVETYRVGLGSMSLENHVGIGTMSVEHIFYLQSLAVNYQFGEYFRPLMSELSSPFNFLRLYKLF